MSKNMYQKKVKNRWIFFYKIGQTTRNKKCKNKRVKIKVKMYPKSREHLGKCKSSMLNSLVFFFRDKNPSLVWQSYRDIKYGIKLCNSLCRLLFVIECREKRKKGFC